MKVFFVQSGGFVGAVKGCEVDTAELDQDEARQLEGLVRDSGLDDSCTFLSEPGRDLQHYEITIEDQAGPVCVTFDDHSVPSSAKLLLGFLKQRAKPRKLAQ